MPVYHYTYWTCLDRDSAGSLPARQRFQPQATKIGHLRALTEPGSSDQTQSKHAHLYCGGKLAVNMKYQQSRNKQR